MIATAAVLDAFGTAITGGNGWSHSGNMHVGGAGDGGVGFGVWPARDLYVDANVAGATTPHGDKLDVWIDARRFKRLIADYARGCKDPETSIELSVIADGDGAASAVELIMPDGAAVKLAGMPNEWTGDNLRELQLRSDVAAHDVSIKVDALLEGLNQSAYAMAQDDARYYLEGVKLDVHGDGTLRVIGCDAHRLAVYEASEGVAERFEGACEVIIPRDVAVMVHKAMGRSFKKGGGGFRAELEIQDAKETREAAVRFSMPGTDGGMRWRFKWIEGSKYPDWRRVTEKTWSLPPAAIADGGALAKLCKRAKVLEAENINFHKDGENLVFEAVTGENAGMSEVELRKPVGLLTADAGKWGDPDALQFNSRYIAEVAGLLSAAEKVEMVVTDNSSAAILTASAGVVKHGTARHVVMPMRW